MSAQSHSISLSPEQVKALAVKLADLRHNVNNQLSLIVAATELMRRRPEAAARFVDSLADQPGKIAREIKAFSDDLERVLQVRQA
jgi:hypothetical protein